MDKLAFACMLLSWIFGVGALVILVLKLILGWDYIGSPLQKIHQMAGKGNPYVIGRELLIVIATGVYLATYYFG